MTALNHAGEPLHTGDDERIDCVTDIRAAVEELLAELALGDEITEALSGILESCDRLDALLIATIAEERKSRPL